MNVSEALDISRRSTTATLAELEAARNRLLGVDGDTIVAALERLRSAIRYRQSRGCCDLHRAGVCCDPDDCGPCCERCPECPTLQRTGRMPKPPLSEGERGELEATRCYLEQFGAAGHFQYAARADAFDELMALMRRRVAELEAAPDPRWSQPRVQEVPQDYDEFMWLFAVGPSDMRREDVEGDHR